MAASDFFARWAKTGSTASVAEPMREDLVWATATATAATGANAADRDTLTAPELLTADHANQLEAGAGIAAFMRGGVDDAVRRLALKRLFADPQFNVMDGLDTYIDDYNTFTPMSAALVASLNHGKALLADWSDQAQPLARLLTADEGLHAASDTGTAIDIEADAESHIGTDLAHVAPDVVMTADVTHPITAVPAARADASASPIALDSTGPSHVLPSL